jgi:hypothetical protein
MMLRNRSFIRIHENPRLSFATESLPPKFGSGRLRGRFRRTIHARSIEKSVALMITAGVAPAGPVSLGVLADAASQSMSGFGPGIVGRTLLRSPTRMALVLLMQFLSAWLAAWLAGRFATRRGLSRTVRRRWQWISLLFGPAAVLTLASLHAQPVTIVCDECRRKRVIDNVKCEHCGAAQQAAASDGTEIIGTLHRTAGSSSSEAAAELAV